MSWTVSAEETSPPGSTYKWRDQWALGPGLKVEIDTEGYQYPTALAFVPEPGSAPGDPLYFVVEVRGKVKVVSNDRNVHLFDDGFLQTEYDKEIPEGSAEFGAAGICLDPANGYVFITFTYQDPDKILRNDIIRYEVEPGRCSLRPRARTRFTDLFLPYRSGVSHQIGPCKVEGDHLYVGVGDGFDTPVGSQALDSLLGKVLRLTMDGRPAAGNPFLDPAHPDAPEAYIWAYGLRNPFSMELVEGRVFLADNGLDTDRFLEVDRGRNYLWDGTSRSIGINVPAVIHPSVGPVQMAYLPPSSELLRTEDRGKFYVALSGPVSGIMAFDYDLESRMMRRAPGYFMQAIGGWKQMLTGLSVGPDGLYFSPLYSDPDGRSPVLRITTAPESAMPGALLENPDPWTLMYERGCYGCHKLGALIKGGTAGPPLDREPLIEKLMVDLNDPAYLSSLDEIDRLDEAPQNQFHRARQEVREAQGMERLKVWMKYRIHEPRFDRISTDMPNMSVSLAEADRLTRFLLRLDRPAARGWKARIKGWLPRNPRTALGFALGGFLAGGLSVLAGMVLLRRTR